MNIEFGQGAFGIENFYSKQECERFIEHSESVGYRPASINTQMGPRIQAWARNNDRVIMDDFDLAQRLYERLVEQLPTEIDSWKLSGLNERFRFYRYQNREYFRWHYDGSFIRDVYEHSKLTLLIYLNEGFEGGETEFEFCKVAPKTGMALIFPHRLKHQGAILLSGTKYVLRTDVMYVKPTLGSA